ncbi:hypothetical protein [Polyangium aurulentum]|uniref:hypothetical protein n=1 Tax=Polyangium aurulentum TaxID=2567896 RepID=UPI001F2D04B1|nr:hypothetical protein [Polyangium aurulentum]
MRRAALAAVLLAALSISSVASAAEPEALFQEGASALARGEYGTAIERFEAMSDLGFAHPDASFDRGLAYVARVRAGADRPGDLGRAAAAFEEALLLRPGDQDADRALDLVRAEVTRRRARRSKDTASVRPTLDRVVVGLASERAWSLLALSASILLAVGLALRTRPRGPLQVTGRILAPTALVLLCVLVPLAIGARRLRLTTRPGVVVVPEAHLVDEAGTALGGDPIPEAASVEVGDTRGALIHVRWGATEGWVPSGSVRLLGL